MSKKMFALITGIVGGCASIATALITFFQPSYSAAIVGAVGIVSTAVVEVCNLFVRKQE